MNKLWFFLPLFLLVGCHKKEAPKPRPPAIVYTAIAQAKDVRLYKTYVGHIAPFIQVDIRSQVEGELTGIFFDEGDDVESGDLLFTIDSRPYEAQLAHAEAELAQNLANLSYAEDLVARNTKLAEQQYISRIQYDEYVTEVMAQQALVKQSLADIETAKINITYCNIHAPVEGVTGVLQIEQGNLITNAGETPLITVNQIQPVKMYFSVPQKDLPQIMALHRKEELPMEAFLNGNKEQKYKGQLDLIDNTLDDSTGSILLRGIFANEEQMLWPGEFVDVRLYLDRIKNGILIPYQAVVLGQNGSYVFVLKPDQTVNLRYVKTGQKMGPSMLILKGLKAGEEVVTKGQINLSKGDKVTVKQP